MQSYTGVNRLMSMCDSVFSQVSLTSTWMENVAIAKCAITGLPLFHSVLSFVVIRSQPWGLGLNDPCVCVCVFGDVLPRAGCVWHCTVEVQVCGSRRKPPCFSLPLLLLHLLLLLLLWTIFVFLERRSFKKKTNNEDLGPQFCTGS